jgi:hypothetical protein
LTWTAEIGYKYLHDDESALAAEVAGAFFMEVSMPARKANPNSAAMASIGFDLTPLAYMLQVLRDPKSSSDQKQWAAEAAAPYCHAKLSSFEHTGEVVLCHDDVDDNVE